MEPWLEELLAALALPKVGLPAIFVVTLISATLLPVVSEPVVFGYVKLDPTMFWPAVIVATVGNTIGGAISYWMGYGVEVAVERVRHKPVEHRVLGWLERFGPKACIAAFLPVVGDPLCAVAGWLKLPFWPCVAWMTIGKFARYVLMTAALLWVFPERL